MTQFTGKQILLLDGGTSQCLDYAHQMRAAGCEVTVLCHSRMDVCFVSRYPHHKVLAVSSPQQLEETEASISRLIESGRYDLVIPFTEYSARILSRRKAYYSQYLTVIVSDPDVFDFAQNKNCVMRFCTTHGIPCPRTAASVRSTEDVLRSGLSFPIILKPERSFGARGFHRVHSPGELRRLVQERSLDLSEMVVQESLPEDSLCVSENLYIDRHGRVQSAFLYKSTRFYPIDGGSGVMNITFDDPQIHQTCIHLARMLHLTGLIGIDLMIDSRDGIAKVSDINLRAGACARAGFRAGVNQARQILEDVFFDQVTPVFSYRSDVRIRRSQIDILWFLKSPDRFRTEPSWFSWKNTTDQLFSWRDPLPWIAFSLHGVLHYRQEMAQRS